MQGASRFRSLMNVLPIIAGVAAGVASSVVLAASADPPESPAAERSATPAEAATPGAPRPRQPAAMPQGDAVTRRLAALENQVGELSERDPALREASPDIEQEARQKEAQDRVADEEFRAKLALYRQEAVDAAWADTTKPTLAASLGALSESEHHGALDGVDCRSTGCLATVSFASYDDARAGYGRYVTAIHEDVRCARTTVLEEPEDPAAPFAVKILFENCQR